MEPHPSWRELGTVENGYVLTETGWVATPETKRAALRMTIATYVTTGAVVVDSGDYWAVISGRSPGIKVNHVLHLVLTILTCFWVVAWIILSSTAKRPSFWTIRIDIGNDGRPYTTKLR